MQPLKEISVQFIKGVGPSKKKLFEKLGVETIEDLLYFFPRRYEDRTQMTPLSEVKPGDTLTVTGKVMARGARQSWYTRKHVYEMAVDDGRGRLFVVWFNQPYLDKYFSVGTPVVL
ncbi:MAG TPA: DNA helicase RecG, partial [Candidatus Omnitrophota bacterium]|nr:DNA helicase RecG [Candidatus Omnitrophota bacterium]